MARSILIAGYYGFGNLGDEAILAALVEGLRRQIGDVKISAVGGSPRSIEEQHENVTALDWRDLTGLVESARRADLLILGGGGIFHDYWEIDPKTILTPNYGGIAYYSSIPLLAHLLNKPCQILSVGVGPLRTEEGRNYTRLAVELAQEASVRDRESKELLASIGVQGLDKIHVGWDPTLLLEPAPDPQVRVFLQSQGLKEDFEYVAVNLRHWDFDVDSDVWPQEVARALDNILAETEDHILFIPFQAMDRTPYENDLALIREVRAGMDVKNRTHIIEDIPSPTMMLGIIRSCKAVIAMRLHAAIFAVSQGVPTISLSYDPKTVQWMNQMGLKDFALTPDDWTVEAIHGAWKRIPSQKLAETRPILKSARDLIEEDFLRAQALLGTDVGPARLSTEIQVRDFALTKVNQLIEITRRSEEKEKENQELINRLKNIQTELDANGSELEALQATHEQAKGEWEVQRAIHEQAKKEWEELQALHEQAEEEWEERQGEHRAALNRLEGLETKLDEIESSRGWKLVRWLWRLRLKIAPPGSARERMLWLLLRTYKVWRAEGLRAVVGRAKTLIQGGGTNRLFPHWWSTANDSDWHISSLEKFLDTQIGPEGEHLVIIFAAVPLVLSEGQRSMWLTRAFSARGVPVVYACWRWFPQDIPSDMTEYDNIIQIPLDVFITRGDALLNRRYPSRLQKLLLLEFPHPSLFRIVNVANAYGWTTIYDVIDDWEEFYRVGQAIWYDPEFEVYLLNNVDHTTATTKALSSKMMDLGAEGIHLLGNAYEGASFAPSDRKEDVPQGEITIGYFGHLTPSWFDWDALVLLARRHPEWLFHIIGYGDEPRDDLPGNILRLGKIPHEHLSAYAANWDVAIIPFKPNILAGAVDPVKVYEYLALGLPVVTQGMPHLEEMPCVRNAQTIDELEQLIIEANVAPFQGDEVMQFLSKNTWDDRANTLIDLMTATERTRPWDQPLRGKGDG